MTWGQKFKEALNKINDTGEVDDLVSVTEEWTKHATEELKENVSSLVEELEEILKVISDGKTTDE